MKKKLFAILICYTVVLATFSGCGSKDMAGSEKQSIEEEKEAVTTEPVVEKEEQIEEAPEVPEMMEVEYNFNEGTFTLSRENLFVFKEGLAWVAYDNDDTTLLAVINTDGKLIYSFSPQELFGNEVSISDVGLTLFTNGKSAIYTENQGFVIIDSNGDEVLNEIGEEKYFSGYTEDGEMIYAIHSAGFSDESWDINKINADGSVKKMDMTVDDMDSAKNMFKATSCWQGNSAKLFKLSDGVYIKDGALFNGKTGKVVEITGSVQGITSTESEKRVSLGVRGDFLPTIDRIEVIETASAFEEMLFEDDVLYSTLNDHIYNMHLFNVDYSMALEDVKSVNFDDYGIYNVTGELLCKIPTSVSSGMSVDTADYDGTNFACLSKGADGNYYLIMIDNSGEMCFEPYKIGSSDRTNYLVVLKGYVFLQKDGEDIVISPQGEEVTDWSDIGSDAYVNMHSFLREDMLYIIPRISEGFIYYSGSGKIVSSDGKLEITGVKAEIPYDATLESSATGDEEVDKANKDNKNNDELSDISDFVGYYEDPETGYYVSIGEDFVIAYVENTTSESDEKFSEITYNNGILYIEFDDGWAGNFSKIEGENRFELAMASSGELYYFERY